MCQCPVHPPVKLVASLLAHSHLLGRLLRRSPLLRGGLGGGLLLRRGGDLSGQINRSRRLLLFRRDDQDLVVRVGVIDNGLLLLGRFLRGLTGLGLGLGGGQEVLLVAEVVVVVILSSIVVQLEITVVRVRAIVPDRLPRCLGLGLGLGGG